MADDTVQTLIDDPVIGAVEIKLTVRDDQEQLVRDALGHADIKPEKRVVYFFDTDDLDRYEAGLVLREDQDQGRPHLLHRKEALTKEPFGA